MKVPFAGAIDCDLHPLMPSATALLPYLDEYWRDQLVNRHIDRYSFVLTSYPPYSPLSARPDWRQISGLPAGDIDAIRRHALDPFGTRLAICNVLHGAVALFNEDMAAALCAAVNDWTAKELLDREPRLRASILLPVHNPALALREIERLAPDRRFVQVLLLAMGEMLLGRRTYWPIYAAAEKHGLAIGIHAGSTYHHAPTPSGWPAHRVEDYVAQSAAFESQLLSFLTEGVFQKFPALKLVLIESGVTWLPTLLWRTNKTWRGVRPEVPWIDRPPAELLREHVRLTLQPLDVPRGDPQRFARVLDHVGSDRMLLFSTDYPHWHFDGEDVLPDGLTDDTLRRFMIDNPLETYPRLRDGTVADHAVLRDNASASQEHVR
ncbi:MAG TPA: amidohydrolase family protein [Bradyrhizobium sp.]|jgi:predicted TIM-barrel fold metal-dependent hydrolase|nr:amidohydrolase family protein [Bradyrhizobium sp.]